MKTKTSADPAVAPDMPRLPNAEFLLRGAGLFYGATLIALGGRVLIALLIAQALGATALGLYSLGYATVQALSMLATNGEDVGLIHFVSPAFKKQDWGTVRDILNAALVTTLPLSILAALGMALLFPHFLGTSAGSAEVGAAPWFALAIVPEVLGGVLASYGLACGRPSAKAIPDRVFGTIVQLGLTFLGLRLGWGEIGIVLSFVANSIISLVITAIMVYDLYPRRIATAGYLRVVGPLFRYSWKLGLSNAASYVLLNAALFILGATNAAEAGIYAAASRLTFPGSLFLESFGQAFIPHAAGRRGDPSFEREYQRVTLWMLSSSAPIFIILFAFAGTWMGLLGPDFASGGPTLAVMALAQLLDIMIGPSGVSLGVSHRPGIKIINIVVAWGANLILVLVLTPQLGALGAAIGFLVAIALNDIFEYAEVFYLLHVRPWGKHLLKPAAVLVGLSAILLTLSYALRPLLPGAVFLSIAFLIAYIILMWQVGLPAADVETLRNAAIAFFPQRWKKVS